MVLSEIEREEFLAQPHLAALSVNAGDDRGTLTVPIWCINTHPGASRGYSPAPARTRPGSSKRPDTSRSWPRPEPIVRYVAVDGPVAGIEPGGDELLVELANRYLPSDRVDI